MGGAKTAFNGRTLLEETFWGRASAREQEAVSAYCRDEATFPSTRGISFLLGSWRGVWVAERGIASKLSAVCFTGCCWLFDCRLTISMEMDKNSRTPLE